MMKIPTEHTGGTRLLNGWGGRIGIIIRRMTKTEHINDRKASARAGMSGIMVVVVVVNKKLNHNQTRNQTTRGW
jgi:hypothetical protein